MRKMVIVRVRERFRKPATARFFSDFVSRVSSEFHRNTSLSRLRNSAHGLLDT